MPFGRMSQTAGNLLLHAILASGSIILAGNGCGVRLGDSNASSIAAISQHANGADADATRNDSCPPSAPISEQELTARGILILTPEEKLKSDIKYSIQAFRVDFDNDGFEDVVMYCYITYWEAEDWPKNRSMVRFFRRHQGLYTLRSYLYLGDLGQAVSASIHDLDADGLPELILIVDMGGSSGAQALHVIQALGGELCHSWINGDRGILLGEAGEGRCSMFGPIISLAEGDCHADWVPWVDKYLFRSGKLVRAGGKSGLPQSQDEANTLEVLKIRTDAHADLRPCPTQLVGFTLHTYKHDIVLQSLTVRVAGSWDGRPGNIVCSIYRAQSAHGGDILTPILPASVRFSIPDDVAEVVVQLRQYIERHTRSNWILSVDDAAMHGRPSAFVVFFDPRTDMQCTACTDISSPICTYGELVIARSLSTELWPMGSD